MHSAVRAQHSKEGDREGWIPFCGTGIKSRASGMLSKYSTKTHRYKQMTKGPNDIQSLKKTRVSPQEVAYFKAGTEKG